MDSVSIDDKYYYSGYIDKDFMEKRYKFIVNHIEVTHKPALEIVNEISSRGTNVAGFNPFINFKFENHMIK
jgi:hypothetical protein